MRNKGFFWFLTILLTIVCIYQLSFTWVTTSEEKKAEKEAMFLVDSLRADAKKTIILPFYQMVIQLISINLKHKNWLSLLLLTKF
jgi:hypothetical protein